MYLCSNFKCLQCGFYVQRVVHWDRSIHAYSFIAMGSTGSRILFWKAMPHQHAGQWCEQVQNASNCRTVQCDHCNYIQSTDSACSQCAQLGMCSVEIYVFFAIIDVIYPQNNTCTLWISCYSNCNKWYSGTHHWCCGYENWINAKCNINALLKHCTGMWKYM